MEKKKHQTTETETNLSESLSEYDKLIIKIFNERDFVRPEEDKVKSNDQTFILLEENKAKIYESFESYQEEYERKQAEKSTGIKIF